MFVNKQEIDLSKEFIKKGYVIKNVEDLNSLEWIKKLILDSFNDKKFDNLNDCHKFIKKKELNEFRFKIINKINSNKKLREKYYNLIKETLHLLVGNELVMQNKINLSIQYPNDSSSLLETHADTWSGDSPYEVVVWLPLVDCYKTKSMYILPPEKLSLIDPFFKGKGEKKIFTYIKNDVNFLKVNFGQILVFNQTLPHGNVENREKETRWTMNCRFKSIFTPYWDKKIGEFFSPISLKAVSKLGLNYKLPEL